MRCSTGCRAAVARRNVRNDFRSAIARALFRSTTAMPYAYSCTTITGGASLQRMFVLDRHDAHELPHELFPMREDVSSARARRVLRVSLHEATHHALLVGIQHRLELERRRAA